MSENLSTSGGAAPHEQRRQLRALPQAARLLSVPVIAVVVIHSLLIALWVAPMTPIREELGNDTLRSYVMPWFEQNWSIFAPNPRRTAVTFEVRALTEDQNGERLTTEWIDLVEIEDQIVAGNPLGSRTSKITRRLADRMHSARSTMNEDQESWLEANYVETPVETLRSRLLSVEGGTGAHHVDRYMQADRSATMIATAVAERTVDGPVIHVQYRTSTRPAPSWENRHEQDLDEQNRTYRDYGWRAPAELTSAELELFDHYLDRLEGSP
ncbi:DUF5819 family protein [Nesterenkonia flava]|uniref:DUF5819 family protein n=1 Tax=Nesterenkonia flava TaxID=469799 RepID=A0ABU1FV98_9MICC|nr:DUF5819 family protein [Nesterenkonia flava]MDR5712588.1 DUF5819 family protein [Nesterenkonia flava]